MTDAGRRAPESSKATATLGVADTTPPAVTRRRSRCSGPPVQLRFAQFAAQNWSGASFRWRPWPSTSGQEKNRRPPVHRSCMETRVVADHTLGIPHAGTDELLTPGQAGDYVCTGERFVRRLIAERRIDYVKLSKHVRVQRSVLDGFIQAGRVPRVPDIR